MVSDPNVSAEISSLKENQFYKCSKRSEFSGGLFLIDDYYVGFFMFLHYHKKNDFSGALSRNAESSCSHVVMFLCVWQILGREPAMRAHLGDGTKAVAWGPRCCALERQVS